MGSTGPAVTDPEPPLLIEQVSSIEVDGARSYEVTPAQRLRARVTAQLVEQAWQQVLTHLPEADTPGVHDQFVCHVYFAARKAVWHLEPWRPDVGYPATVAAGCNPGPVPDPDRG